MNEEGWRNSKAILFAKRGSTLDFACRALMPALGPPPSSVHLTHTKGARSHLWGCPDSEGVPGPYPSLLPSRPTRTVARQSTSPTTSAPDSSGEMACWTGSGTKSERPTCSASHTLSSVRPTLMVRTTHVWLVAPFPICTNSSLGTGGGGGRSVSGKRCLTPEGEIWRPLPRQASC